MPGTQASAKERDARSRAAQRVAREPLLRGSLVLMRRRCGKQGCHCLQGERHPALYLAARRGSQRTMIYVPPDLEETVRAWLATGQQVDALLDFVSQQCLEQFIEQKQQVLGRLQKAPQKRRRKGKQRAP